MMQIPNKKDTLLHKFDTKILLFQASIMQSSYPALFRNPGESFATKYCYPTVTRGCDVDIDHIHFAPI